MTRTVPSPARKPLSSITNKAKLPSQSPRKHQLSLDNFFSRPKRESKLTVEDSGLLTPQPTSSPTCFSDTEVSLPPAKKRKALILAPEQKAKPRRAQSQKKFSNITATPRVPRVAADQSDLPPFSNIPKMFADLVSRAEKLPAVVDRLAGRKLRVATMCSGTESPLLALRMITRALEEQEGKKLEIEHIFSCEIEPFKQAYIERNFAPPILFRDVLELADDYAYFPFFSWTSVNVDIPPMEQK